MSKSEKQAAFLCSRTLVSTKKRLQKLCGNYGHDFPYINSSIESVIERIDEALDDFSNIRKEDEEDDHGKNHDAS